MVIESNKLAVKLDASSITGTLAISDGGTGATTAAAARTALNVDEAGTDNSTNVTLASVTGNYLTLSGQQITAGTVPVSLGGTGATTAAAARTALGVDAAGTDNSTNVTLASVTGNYLTLSGQQITAGTVPVSLGGTGATTAAAARTALGVDAAGTDNSTNVTLASVTGNYLTLSGQQITAGTVPVSLGGTGATTAAAARTALNVDEAGTDNSTNVTLASVTGNYLTLSGQQITAGTVPVSLGGTGATTAAAARTALDVDQAGTDNSTNVTLASVTGNYLTLSGQQITAGTVPVSLGGTGATTAAAARTALDVDQAGTDNSTNVTLASVTGNYLTLSGQQITAGTVPVSLGGTGATTAAAARTALNVDEAGTDNSTNVTLASVTGNYLTLSGQQITAGTVPVSLGGTGATTAAAARTALGVDAAGTDNSTNVTLASVTGNYLTLSGQQITAGTVPVSLGGTGATTAAAARTALGVDAAGTDNSTNVTLASVTGNYLTLSGQQITAGTVPVSLGGTGATTAAAARTALGVDAAGTDNSTNVTLASVTGNYLTLSGQQITAGTVPVSLGGTGATTAATARTAFGLPSNCLTEANSIYIGSDPSSSTDTANGNASSNIAVGVQAMDAVTTGKENIAIGYQSLTNNTTGNANTAIGHQAAKTYTGDVITAIGYDCLIDATGANNTGVGAWALTNCVNGTSNTAVGYNAGNVITSGSDNVIIGYLANASGATGTNEIVIGQNVTGQGNNKAVIGNDSITDVYMARDSGATVHCGGLTVGTNSVVGARGAAVADCATAIAGNGTIAATYDQSQVEALRDAVAELQTQLNEALSRLRAHGLIAT